MGDRSPWFEIAVAARLDLARALDKFACPVGWALPVEFRNAITQRAATRWTRNLCRVFPRHDNHHSE